MLSEILNQSAVNVCKYAGAIQDQYGVSLVDARLEDIFDDVISVAFLAIVNRATYRSHVRVAKVLMRNE